MNWGERLNKTWFKSSNILRAVGGKIDKPKHNLKVYLWGGISRKGLTNFEIFEGKIDSTAFQNILS